ncbi:hypothetical protein EDB83DRAFT_2549266 [Lactarius deliciosus]|nr:hypothetical protein EDB83DRAFT_2549266 [Lactarius deliciosus]
MMRRDKGNNEVVIRHAWSAQRRSRIQKRKMSEGKSVVERESKLLFTSREGDTVLDCSVRVKRDKYMIAMTTVACFRYSLLFFTWVSIAVNEKNDVSLGQSNNKPKEQMTLRGAAPLEPSGCTRTQRRLGFQPLEATEQERKRRPGRDLASVERGSPESRDHEHTRQLADSRNAKNTRPKRSEISMPPPHITRTHMTQGQRTQFVPRSCRGHETPRKRRFVDNAIADRPGNGEGEKTTARPASSSTHPLPRGVIRIRLRIPPSMNTPQGVAAQMIKASLREWRKCG